LVCGNTKTQPTHKSKNSEITLFIIGKPHKIVFKQSFVRVIKKTLPLREWYKNTHPKRKPKARSTAKIKFYMCSEKV